MSKIYVRKAIAPAAYNRVFKIKSAQVFFWANSIILILVYNSGIVLTPISEMESICSLLN